MMKINAPKINLSVFGCLRAVDPKPNTDPKPKFDWNSALADSGILAALTFFTSLTGITVIGVETLPAVTGALVTSISQFFTLLALKRKLVKAEGC